MSFLIYKEKVLSIEIFYDSKEIDSEDEKITITFRNVCFHKFTNFPGVDESKINFESYDDITSLVEFLESDYKRLWEIHYQNLLKLRHVRIFFTSANHYLEVICEELSII